MDSITFSGNGEPSLHPEFHSIIDEVVPCRNKYAPEAVITVITNATTLSNPAVFNSLQKIDKPFLKLDAGNEKMFRQINRSSAKLDFEQIVGHLIRFNGKGIVQTMLIRSADFDNTTETEIASYLSILRKIKPKSVMLYGLDREAPMLGLEKVREGDLKQVAEKIRNLGIPAEYFV